MASHVWVMLWLTSAYSIAYGQDIEVVPRETWAAEIMGWAPGLDELPALTRPDKAHLIVQDATGEGRQVFMQHDQCFGCPLEKQGDVGVNSTLVQVIQTKFGNYIQLESGAGDNKQVVCSGKIHLYDKGEYWLIVNSKSGTILCDLVLWNDPPNIYLVLLWAFLVYFGLAVIWIIWIKLYDRQVCRKCRPSHGSQDLADFTSSTTVLELKDAIYTSNGSTNGSVVSVDKAHETAPPTPAAAPRERLRSLDAFRGFSLIVMIYVNYGYCCNYFFFQHAHWNGLQIADIVFPWFIWIMGTSMAFSFRSVVRKQVPAWKVIWKVVFRSIKLFALGIFLATKGSNDMVNVRIPGVLQRFSLTYLFCALIHYPFAKLAHKDNKPYSSCKGCDGPVRDVLWYWPEWVVQLGILGAHIGITFGLSVPGCPKGYLGPGGWHDGGTNFNCTGGAAGYIDRLLIGNNMYKWAEIRDLYGTNQYYDPEGILGTITSIFHCFLGLQAGKIIMTYKSHKSRIVRWLIWGLITGGIGTLLCKASQNDGWIPLNKNLWSVSFVFVMSGTAFLVLIVMYLVIDVWKIWTGAPFIYPGMNSIVVYVCHSAFANYFPISWQMPDTSYHWQWQIVSLWGATFWVIVAYIMYRKKFFVAL